MRLYIIAGEASGDLHGSNLIKALKKRETIAIHAWGGDRMEAAGAVLRKHYRDLAFMGFVEVALNIRTILRNFKFCKQDIVDFQPDALVLIDYPGFNLRMAKWAKQQGIKVIYYISPQIWAWHTSRVHNIKKVVDKMLVILPFEKAFYAQHGMEVEYVGHPLLDAIEAEKRIVARDGSIALLAGSRQQEVERLLPIMLGVARRFPERNFVVAGATSLDAHFYEKAIQGLPNVRFEQGNTYTILQKASAALVKSGTSTLETALFNVPQIVCYTGSPISYQIAKRVVKVDYISLVNLILDRPLVPELIQSDCTVERVAESLNLLFQEKHSDAQKKGYAELKTILGGGGASERAAAGILTALL